MNIPDEAAEAENRIVARLDLSKVAYTLTPVTTKVVKSR